MDILREEDLLAGGGHVRAEDHVARRVAPGAALVYSPSLAAYRFGFGHPFTPDRHLLAVELMRAWGLLEVVAVVEPPSADDADIALVHDAALIEAVRAAGVAPERADSRYGIGPGDTPAFLGMHEATLAVVGATIATVEAVLGREVERAFNPAGGLHHAHRHRSAGFCVYNDCAVAIERATRARPGLKVAYVDIDVHHGDGVEEAFYDRSDVLTVSVHESGAYLYPGSGNVHDMGSSDGYGFALNVPLVPGAGADSYAVVCERIVGPALQAFEPGLIVLQGGADTHRDDPLAGLDNTVEGYVDTVTAIAGFAQLLCDGRLAMVGGGGYESYSAVPRMWAAAMAVLADVDVPRALPPEWLDSSHRAARFARSAAPLAPSATFAEGSPEPERSVRATALEATVRTIERLERGHPLLDGMA